MFYVMELILALLVLNKWITWNSDQQRNFVTALIIGTAYLTQVSAHNSEANSFVLKMKKKINGLVGWNHNKISFEFRNHVRKKLNRFYTILISKPCSKTKIKKNDPPFFWKYN